MEEVEAVFAESFSQLQEKVQLRAQSELLSISDDAFAAGLKSMKRAAADYCDEKPILISGGLFVFRRRADR